MKTRIIVATGTAVAAGLIGAGGASALVGVNLTAPTTSTVTVTKGNDSSNGADNGIHDTKKVVYWDCDAGTETSTQPTDGHYLTYNGPKDIWPPNHKYRHLTISATGHEDDSIVLTVTGSSDETIDGEELNGAGNTDNDYVGPDMTPVAVANGTGTASTPYKVRGERSGHGDGRTYSFDTMATFDDETEPCTHTFTATVPHDQRNHTNSGPKNGGKTKKARKARRARR